MSDDMQQDRGEPRPQRPVESGWEWSDLPTPGVKPSLFAAVPLMPTHTEWRN